MLVPPVKNWRSVARLTPDLYSCFLSGKASLSSEKYQIILFGGRGTCASTAWSYLKAKQPGVEPTTFKSRFQHPYRYHYTTKHRRQRRWEAGDTPGTSPALFGQPGTKYFISPAKFVKFLLSHAKRHGSKPPWRYEHGVVLRLTQTRTRKLYPITTIIVIFAWIFV